ncbi:hypothetical protein PTQ27_09100 [Mannheimia sp. AT1]|uniref:Uncharacterized protein n=1 Tax=Mannheimia cairinae TaxID=3025936 RepID=A0ABT5MQZ6_9PAST|nr:hypothetical protein [Mannheimia cairinae]MDD0824613.1 hypothetical protein [Mannheimia cairinae]MDD0826458.1 hypothetical protein [Mannheimia cairinae]
MIGYDYTDAAMQPPYDEDEDAFIELEERLIELLGNNGFSAITDALVGSDSWVAAIESYLDEQRKRREEF